ncbi:type II secretion system protein GspG, partial [bacterium]|nr:type II secretion system protein GspG [bacterium]
MIRKNEYGMTLIEIVIVIAIIATLASVAIPTLITSLDVQDNKNTKSNMNALKTAMLNYYRDVGSFPSLTRDQKAFARAKWGVSDFDNLDALVYNPFNPESDDVREFVDSDNWNGPYILSSFNKDDYKFDAWGQKFFYDPDYGNPFMGESFGSFGQTGSAKHGGVGVMSSNAALLVSQGKVRGFGRKEDSQGNKNTGWYGIVDWEKLQKFTPTDLFPSSLSDEDYIAMIVDPRAERSQGTHGSYDDEKIASTKQMLQDLKSAVIDFVYDVGVAPPYNQTGAVNDVR